VSSAPQTPKKIQVEGCRAVFSEQLADKKSKISKRIPDWYFREILRSIGGKPPMKT